MNPTTHTFEQMVFPLGRERDACGVGAVAVERSKVGRVPLEMALRAVGNFEHRGACMPDGTGDGTGFLMDLPKQFFVKELKRLAPNVDASFMDGTGWGVATLFINQGTDEAAVNDVFKKTLASVDMELMAWREVPLNKDPLGLHAKKTAPHIVQAIIKWEEFANDLGTSSNKMVTQLHTFHAMRHVERAFAEANLPVYVASFSDKTIVYKGMMEGKQFGEAFPDLHDPDFHVNVVIFHRRFATNTAPNWSMCQPFRVLCHNGEINTISGNRNSLQIWENYINYTGQVEQRWPQTRFTVDKSDSADLDSAVNAYHAEGRSLAYTAACLMPPSWENKVRNLSVEMKAFFEYHKRAMGGLGAWEGPAAILAYDGHQLVTSLDRMGLRPLRVSQNDEGVFLASSENGIFDHHPDKIVHRKQLIPGDIVCFNLESGRIEQPADVYFDILHETSKKLGTTFRDTNYRCVRTPTRYGMDKEKSHPDLSAFRGRVGGFLRAFGWDSKLKQDSTDHLIDFGKEDIYCMGYDRAMPFLSVDGPTLYRFFFQRFALVTNPPIDPYREGRDMSLITYLGAMPDVPPRVGPERPNWRIKSPILTSRTIKEIVDHEEIPTRVLDCSVPSGSTGKDLAARLDVLIAESVESVKNGTQILVLSDRGCFEKNHWPIPSPLAVASVNHALAAAGLRPLCSIVAQTGEIIEGHDVAVLLGLGANAVHPHALFRYTAERSRRNNRPVEAGFRNVQEGLEEAVRKIMSKMGIATVQGYMDSCLFEAVGLGPDVMKYLPRVPSRIGGLSLDTLMRDIAYRVRHAITLDELPEFDFDQRAYNDPMRFALWEVSRTASRSDWQRYQRITDSRRPSVLRDLLDIRQPEQTRTKEPLPAQAILRDCVVTGGMSHGALTSNAHQSIAYAANQIGMLSNSGEGGEDRRRNRGGEWEHLRSRIRQVATGRFGVDAEYLVNGDEIQIKMAQGAKPGEGGQLMSSKVTEEIAYLRYCRPGINLISPPPHHDIYSIEDLKQLIYDLKAINPEAKVSVKLCAVTGIGTIAVGVVKAGADIIEIDGLEGSTGASPRSSLEHAGLPTELGLREVHLALTELGLRHVVKLRAAGGVKTEMDAVKYMLLGADQITVATALMIAQGCVHCNLCHTGNCPTLIAGSLNKRAIYPGKGEYVKNWLLGLGAAIADMVAKLGFTHPRELVGRVDLLVPRDPAEIANRLQETYGFQPETLLQRVQEVDLSFLTSNVKGPDELFGGDKIDNMDHLVSLEMTGDDELNRAASKGKTIERKYTLRSCSSVNFATGVAYRIAKNFGRDGWPAKEPIHLRTEGTAGQSYGAFCVKGMDLVHVGSCNDGVAKGMSGGRIAIVQPKGFRGVSWETTLVGNTVAFGATGGKLFVQGQAGQRLGVRNSGATIVCEGAGQYACEYMTNGIAVFLGHVGDSIGAGMTDGKLYIYDPDDSSDVRFKIDDRSVAMATPGETELYDELIPLLQEYYEVTGSIRAMEAMQNLHAFHKVIPIATQVEEMRRKLAIDLGHTIAG
ncbi:MAG: glutamate synthase large subunit [Deltaproteobacteria bacterium]|nr:glutamate synthase large subunit [Deltaproteobacteria bacterium]MCB9478658.1 glutamate synthase large subunit [Deltaproteobacteria bacterium]